MKVSIVRIGNSKGVILPKSIRELVGLSSNNAEMTVEGNAIIISPYKKQKKTGTGSKRTKELQGI
jgi:antitoxin component of MazEF toxin-antitoxin module